MKERLKDIGFFDRMELYDDVVYPKPRSPQSPTTNAVSHEEEDASPIKNEEKSRGMPDHL